MLSLSLHFLLSLIHNTAHCEIHLPKDPLEQSSIDIHNNKVHQHEEDDDRTIQMLIVETVVIDHLRPGTLRQDLNHYVLRMNESLEIGKLGEFTIRRVKNLSFLLSLVEQLHTDYPEYVEKECKKNEEPRYNRKYLHKSLKQSPEFEYKLVLPFLNSLAQYQRPEKKSHSKSPTDHKKILNIIRSADKEEDNIEHNKKRVNIIPPICEVSFRTNRNNSDQYFHKEQPHKDTIKDPGDMIIMKKQQNSIDTTQQSDNTDNHIEKIMLNYPLKMNPLIDKLPEVDPKLTVIKFRRVHNRVVKNDFAQLHKLIDLLYIKKDTIVPLLLSSNFIHISMMYWMYLVFFL